ncbi:hypothetical protein [[Mycoplasma] gypis]|uniref:Uncharacterized protein n=1 Tax=[Mycoplasma] gypis TaxID=92404 RepID=A0ABZ2RMV5_9BACT|nr:hypothetical protein [[Mycoplasma] gypis]MBN0919553.1 hypothetical protein [[Mycoplasma] gypis]
MNNKFCFNYDTAGGIIPYYWKTIFRYGVFWIAIPKLQKKSISKIWNSWIFFIEW